jgi:hypothetical protein
VFGITEYFALASRRSTSQGLIQSTLSIFALDEATSANGPVQTNTKTARVPTREGKSILVVVDGWQYQLRADAGGAGTYSPERHTIG